MSLVQYQPPSWQKRNKPRAKAKEITISGREQGLARKSTEPSQPTPVNKDDDHRSREDDSLRAESCSEPTEAAQMPDVDIDRLVVSENNTNAKCRDTKSVRFAPDTFATPSTAKGIDFTSTVTLIAGENGSAGFIVHKNLLARSSPFFEHLLKPSSGKTGDDRDTIRIPEVHPKGLNIFLHWLYRNDLAHTYARSTSTASSIKHLGYAHALGQLAKMRAFRNYCVREIITLSRHKQLKNVVKVLAQHVYPAAGDTPLAKLCVDVILWDGDRDQMLDCDVAIGRNTRLCREMVQALKKKRNMKNDAKPPYVDNVYQYLE